jgi:hypothetical protein
VFTFCLVAIVYDLLNVWGIGYVKEALWDDDEVKRARRAVFLSVKRKATPRPLKWGSCQTKPIALKFSCTTSVPNPESGTRRTPPLQRDEPRFQISGPEPLKSYPDIGDSQR